MLIIWKQSLEPWSTELETWKVGMVMVGRQMGADLSQKATMPFLVIMVANGVNTQYFNFAAVETSIIVALTALTTVPVLAALLSFVILREATTRRTR